MNHRVSAVALVALLGSACAGGGAPSSTSGTAPSIAEQPAKMLSAMVRVEPADLADRPFREVGVSLLLTKRMFNAELAILDDQGDAQPYLAEALPQLNTDSWKVGSDGTMQTTYRLKPGILWHDGTPLSAQDFVLAWHVYSDQNLAAVGHPLLDMSNVSAPDDRTLVIQWKQPYPDAGAFTAQNGQFPPLPGHILEKDYQSDTPDAFLGLPYWTTEYIGLGPFKLDQWEPGAFLEGTAFDKHILGKPRIERIKVSWTSDTNTVLADMLSGAVQLATDDGLEAAEVPTFEQQTGGQAVLQAGLWRALYAQFRPEYVDPKALLDVHVRQALAYAIDKGPINESIYAGQSIPTDSPVPTTGQEGQVVDKAITKYPFDLAKSAQAMQAAGYTKGADGMYAGPEGLFSVEVKTNGSTANQQEMAAVASGWRKAGFDANEAMLPAAQAQDNQVRSTWAGLYIFSTNAGDPAALNFTTARIPGPDNRWTGGNRQGWSNPQLDKLADAFQTTLDRDQRYQTIAQMAKIISDDVAAASLFFNTHAWVFVGNLTGPRQAAYQGNVAWDMYTWELH